MSEVYQGGVKDTEAAKLLGMSVNTLRRWRIKGNGPAFIKMDSGSVRYMRKDLEEYIQENTIRHDGGDAA